MSIHVTTAAAKKICELLESKSADPLCKFFRILVLGGGCSGFQYDLSLEEKKEEEEEFQSLHDIKLATFLNGLIVKKRGKKDGEQPKPEKTLTNNLILRKLKIALNLKDEDLIQILKLAELNVSAHEISAFFRNPSQPQYRPCKDQILRNFLHGMQLKYRID